MSKLDDLFSTSGDTGPLQGTLPLRIDTAGASEAVLLLHGYTGNPGELVPLGRALAGAGYAVSVPRYPGHGTCRSDFMKTDAMDWARRAFDEYMDLRARYGTIHVVGHSMGGLLAAAVAAAFDAPRLVLLAPAFIVARRSLAFSPWIAPFRPVIRKDNLPTELDRNDPVRRLLHPEYWADDLVVQAAQLRRLQLAARRVLPRLRSRILVIAADADQSVPASVADWLRPRTPAAASFDSKMLAGAGHLFPFDNRSAETIALVTEWMGNEPE